jgi:hypothetical protein
MARRRLHRRSEKMASRLQQNPRGVQATQSASHAAKAGADIFGSTGFQQYMTLTGAVTSTNKGKNVMLAESPGDGR